MNPKIIKLLSSGNIPDITIGWELLISTENEWYTKPEDWYPIFDALLVSNRSANTVHVLTLLMDRLGKRWFDSYLWKSYINRDKAYRNENV